MTAPEWRPAPGFPDYWVSSLGQVRSHRRGGPVKLLRPFTKKRGYKAVKLYAVDGSRERRFVHHLVALAFVGPRPFPDSQIRHLDGNPANNTPANLLWGTAAENACDQLRHGRHHLASRTHCYEGHEFTPENTYVYSSGKRECRSCRRVRDRLRSAKPEAVR